MIKILLSICIFEICHLAHSWLDEYSSFDIAKHQKCYPIRYPSYTEETCYEAGTEYGFTYFHSLFRKRFARISLTLQNKIQNRGISPKIGSDILHSLKREMMALY